MLIEILPLLAAAVGKVDPEEQGRIDALRKTGPLGGTDTMLIFGAALLLAAALFFWAFFIRKRPQTARGSLVIEKRKKGEADEQVGSSGRRRRRKRRPDHPENLPRNPTLMETGGLPPLRPEDTEPPPAPESPQAR